MKFNEKQLQAINYPHDKSLIISAAAGSGKTGVLTEKVFSIIDQGKVKPEQLLVLTFTDNAAYEMRQRIIKRFSDPMLASKLASSHIQTFDSFNMYLVKRYSHLLNIAKDITIMPKEIMESLEKNYLKEILNHYYQEDPKMMAHFISYFDTESDQKTKDAILNIYHLIQKMDEVTKQKVLEEYEKYYLTEEFFDSVVKRLVDASKQIVINEIYFAYALTFLDGDADDEFYHTLEIVCQKDLDDLSFSDEILNETLLNLKALLAIDGFAFIEKVKEYRHFPVKKPKDPIDKRSYHILKNVYATEKAKLFNLVNLGTKDEELKRMLHFKEPLTIIFQIIKELDEMVRSYQMANSSFTFDEIKRLSLKLLHEQKNVLAELQQQFTFIMIDEYQDTNDQQEEFINLIMGGKSLAKVFLVGDSKQAIYRFRNSNVALFMNRIKLMGDDVIYMNENYRTLSSLIIDMNYFFTFYMRKDHGGIDYANKLEQLEVGRKLVASGDTNNIRRIMLDESQYIINNYEKSDLEAYAIVDDIKQKIAQKYQVFDKTINGFRDCTYRDFLILVRVKRGINAYKKIFADNGIPLNFKLDEEIFEIDPLIVLKSLMGSIIEVMEKGNLENKLLYASLARSYIYEIKDNEVFDVLSSGSVQNTKINQDLVNFVNNYKDLNVEQMIMQIIIDFKLIENLYKIGNVTDAINKIEYIYRFAKTLASDGGTIKDFYQVLQDFNSNNITPKEETLNALDDAVMIMTIHASKGLENRVVYLPLSFNRRPGQSKDSVLFDQSLGFLLEYNNYQYDELKETGNSYLKYGLFDLVFKRGFAKDLEDEHEFVRLIYVALTRAINQINIVGNCPAAPMSYKGSFYEALDMMPNVIKIDQKIVELLIKDGVILRNDYERLQQLDDLSMNYPAASYLKDNKQYSYMYQKYYETIKKEEKELITKIKGQIIDFIKSAPLDKSLKYAYLNYHLKEADLNKINAHLKAYYGFKEEVKEEAIDYFLSSIKYDDQIINDCLYLIYGIKNAIYKSYQNDCYIDAKTYFDPEEIVKQKSDNKVDLMLFNQIKIAEDDIGFVEHLKKRASKELVSDNEEMRRILNYGNLLHRLLELTNLKTKDTSFIKDEKVRDIIDHLLTNPLFNDLDNAMIKKEFGYYDYQLATTGFIDLLIIKDDFYYIIDYKTKHLDDDAYTEQLDNYRRNVKTIFKTDDEHIKMYLLSITDGISKEIL